MNDTILDRTELADCADEAAHEARRAGHTSRFPGEDDWCGWCENTGLVPPPTGRAILALLRRHYKP